MGGHYESIFPPQISKEKDSEPKFWRPNIKSGTFFWSPPPAASNVCLEELRKARIKRQDSTHIILIPRLLSPLWMKQLFKTTDLVFSVKPYYEFWSAQEFEPLTIAFCFPYLKSFPWQLRGTPKLYALGRELRRMSTEKELVRRDLLCKLLSQIRNFYSLPPDVVRKVLYFGTPPSKRRSHSGTIRV